MLPQPQLPRLNPAVPPRTLAKPPKAPLRGQAPSGAPVQPTAQIQQVAQAQAAEPQRYQGPAQPQRFTGAPAQVQPKTPTATAIQQQVAPRDQAIAAIRQQTAGPSQYPNPEWQPTPPANYPNPEWQPKPAFMMGAQPQPTAPTGGLVTPTSVQPKTPMVSPTLLGQSVSPRGQAVSSVAQSLGLMPAASPVMDAIDFDVVKDVLDSYQPPPVTPLPPRRMLTSDDLAKREEPITGIDPTSGIDWNAVGVRMDEFDPQKNPGPGYEWDATAPGLNGGQGKWVKTALDKMPPGFSLDDPGWTYTAEEGWQYDPSAAIKADIVGGALSAIDKPLSEYGFNPEEMKAQEDQIIRQAAEAKAKLAQQMAGRGLGGSGLEIAGLGNVDVGAISAMTDLATENKALQIESRLNELKTFLSAYGDQLDDETRKELAAEASDLQKEMFEYDKGQQAESDRHTLLNNMLAQVGAEQWSPDTLAWAYDLLDSGASFTDVLEALKVTGGGEVFVDDAVLAAAKKADDAEASGGSGSSGVAYSPYIPSGPVAPPQDDPGAWVDLYNAYVDEARGTGQDAMSYADWFNWNLNNMTSDKQSQTGFGL